MSTTNRDQLLKLLTLVRPALSTREYVKELMHFQFLNGWVTAFDDKSAISLKCGLDLAYCVPGELMIRALSSFNSESVKLQEGPKGSELLLSSGRSKLKLPVLEAERFPFEEPQGQPDEIELDDAILEGIKKCLFAVGNDPTHPAQMGITLDQNADKKAVLFATDNFTISRYQTTSKIELPGETPIILPTFFCENLVALAQAYPDDEITLQLYPSMYAARFGKKAKLFTRILADTEPLNFEKIVGKHVNVKKLKSQLQPIPVGFDAAIGRAALMTAADEDKIATIKVEVDAISITSQADRGESDDEIEWAGEALDAAFCVDPTLVTRAVKQFGSVAFYDRVMLLANDSGTFIHIISHSSAA